MRQLNREHIDALIELINHGPYFELLDMKICELDIGYARVETDMQRKHFNPFGAIHGGVYSSILDTAAYWAIYCELDEQAGYTSIDVTINNLSMINEGKMIVEGKSIKVGSSMCLAEATAKDEKGKLLAYGTSKMMILKGKQSINHAIETMGYPPLPPKFNN